MDTKFKEGHEKVGGRKVGTPNKTTRNIKDIITKLIECFNDTDIKEVYDKLKDKKPDSILSFFGKIAPKDLNLTGDIKTSKEIDLTKLSEEEIKIVNQAKDIINKCNDDSNNAGND